MTKEDAEGRAIVVLEKYIRSSAHLLTGKEGPEAAFDYMMAIMTEEFMKLTPEKPDGDLG